MDLEHTIQRALLRDEAMDELGPRPKRTAPASHWPRAVMMERAAYLKEMARFSSGVANETVRELSGHQAMMLFRSRTGEAELHEQFADLFVVLAGAATLLAGGRLTGTRTMEPGEMRATALEGGTEQQLRPGDVAYVPAGVPHQMVLTGEQTISCFVLKIAPVEEPGAAASTRHARP